MRRVKFSYFIKYLNMQLNYLKNCNFKKTTIIISLVITYLKL